MLFVNFNHVYLLGLPQIWKFIIPGKPEYNFTFSRNFLRESI